MEKVRPRCGRVANPLIEDS